MKLEILKYIKEAIDSKDDYYTRGGSYQESLERNNWILSNLDILNEFNSEENHFVISWLVNHLSDDLVEEYVSHDLKLDTIKKCYDFFNLWVTKHPENAIDGYMFWDVVVRPFACTRDLSPEFKQIEEAIFNCLTDILKIDNYTCQISALHGFNHLKDDRCKPIIEEFIKNTDDTDLKNMAEMAKEYSAI